MYVVREEKRAEGEGGRRGGGGEEAQTAIQRSLRSPGTNIPPSNVARLLFPARPPLSSARDGRLLFTAVPGRALLPRPNV